MSSKSSITVEEIGELVKQLSPDNQFYILNTINALLFSQQKEKETENS